jgi:hypothetical protein
MVQSLLCVNLGLVQIRRFGLFFEEEAKIGHEYVYPRKTMQLLPCEE